ncbi:MAG: YhcH/YjgK/YiaL family protein [Victivallaceae bacterium]|nr:YhcH/YjgK/YiaL family protein [Victivallaceae bacterium]
MIFDRLDDLLKYAPLAPEALAAAAKFLASAGPDTPDGKQELIGSDVYVSVQSYNGRVKNPDKFEAHREYVDIQLLLAGRETIYAAAKSDLRQITGYSTEKDVEFFRSEGDKETALSLAPGVFALFLPGEAHLPCVGDPAAAIKKVVVKIRRTMFKA